MRLENKQDTLTSMGPDGMHASVRMELTDVTVNSQVSLNDNGYWERRLKTGAKITSILHTNWERSSIQETIGQSALPQFLGRGWNYLLILHTISTYKESKKVIKRSQHWIHKEVMLITSGQLMWQKILFEARI